MDRILRAGLVIAMGLGSCCLVAGCGQTASDQPATASTDTSASISSEAVAKAASDFLEAVLQGDSQRASARLTPQAMQRIIASGKQFAPPGLDTASFRIGQVRAPAEGQALVQCVLTDSSSGESARNEEMCCLMRFVDNDWRVSGIAYGTSPDQPWTLSDFETGQNVSIPRQPSMMSPAGPTAGPTGPANPAVGRPSPPRTAQEAAPVVR
jgi:hypothetical protein